MNDSQVKIKEFIASRALSPTGINLADCVLNPYRGCVYACNYCYAATTKTALKNTHTWGSYVDVKVNICEVLKRELLYTPYKSVLIGSMTEVYQTLEKEYKLMRNILDILGEAKFKVIILTRSPLILRDIDLLQKIEHTIYFTYTPPELAEIFTRTGPSNIMRVEAMKKLVGAGIKVIPYVCPILPGKFTLQKILEQFNPSIFPEVQFENLNLKNIANFNFSDEKFLNEVYSSRVCYESYWGKIIDNLKKLSVSLGQKLIFHCHEYGTFCNLDYKKFED